MHHFFRTESTRFLTHCVVSGWMCRFITASPTPLSHLREGFNGLLNLYKWPDKWQMLCFAWRLCFPAFPFWITHLPPSCCLCCCACQRIESHSSPSSATERCWHILRMPPPESNSYNGRCSVHCVICINVTTCPS